MLGAKTTCKDRWRQVLTEAARSPEKHLCTLEPSISSHQLVEMNQEHLTLVVPQEIRMSYKIPDDVVVLSIADFCELALNRQR